MLRRPSVVTMRKLVCVPRKESPVFFFFVRLKSMSWASERQLGRLNAAKYNGTDQNEAPYRSSDGMQSAIFGPAFWMTIHITSFNYPVHPTETDKTNYATWLWSIGNVLPCRYCRENFPKNMQSANFTMEESMKDRDSFSRFCYNLHDCVNKMLNKTSPPFSEVREHYENFRARCMSEAQKKHLLKVSKELGCIRPEHNGKRGKCEIRIIPQEDQTPAEAEMCALGPNLKIDRQCMKS